MVWHVDMREVGRWCAAVLGLVAALDVPLRASASDGPSAPNAPLEPTPPSPSGEPSQLGRPRIRIEASGPLASRLELRRLEPDPRSITGGQPRWTTVCAMPCDRTVDGTLGQRFVVGGPGVSPSRWFTLLDHRDTTTLVVRPGRRVASVFGWLASGIGIGAVVGGTVAMSFADDDRGRLETGAIVLGTGIALAIVGGLLVWRGRTSVRVGRSR